MPPKKHLTPQDKQNQGITAAKDGNRFAADPALKDGEEATLPFWCAASWLIVSLFAASGFLIGARLLLNEFERGGFVELMTGQVGLIQMFSLPGIWKLIFSALFASAAGLLLSNEIRRSTLHKATKLTKFIALVLITLVIYIPAMHGGFIWDDDQEITANPSLKSTYGLWEIWTGGLSSNRGASENDSWVLKTVRKGLQAIEGPIWGTNFNAHQSPDYFPLKTTMLWVEYRLWGLNPKGYHIMNIVIHALDAVLVWMVLLYLRVPGAWFGALLFAIHPVHVQSVAWISERKNIFSLLFYLLSILSFIKFRQADKKNLYTWALIAFTAALLCKTSVVILPPVLGLIIWWQTGKLTKRDILQLAPFFAISLFLALVTIWFQNVRAIGQEVIPIGDFWSRTAGAGLAVWWYLSKAILPIDLNTIYSRWSINPAQPEQLFAAAMVFVTLAALWVGRHRFGRTPFFVFAYFAGTLFPVLGFFKMSYMRLTLQADHFQYISNIAIVALAGALIHFALQHWSQWKKPLLAACTLLMLSLSAYSWERAGVHLSPKTLWTACLKKNPESWQAHNHLGAVRYMEGDIPEAHKHFERAVELKPDNPEVHNNYALTLGAFGRWEEAVRESGLAVQIKGDVPQMRRFHADCLANVGRFAEAVEQYQIVLQDMPYDSQTYVNLGLALLNLRLYTAAEMALTSAFELDPQNPRTHQALETLRKTPRHGK